MRQFHAGLIAPCRAKLSIVGAVTRAQAGRIATELLSRLPAGSDCAPLPPVAEVAPLAASKEVRIAHPSAQTHVLIGQPGYAYSDPSASR